MPVNASNNNLGWLAPSFRLKDVSNEYMSLDQLKSFLSKMQSDHLLKSEVLASSTADDVANIAQRLGYEVSGDELLRFSGKKVGKVTENDLREIAEIKKEDLNANTVEMAMEMIRGTAKSMGLEVKD